MALLLLGLAVPNLLGDSWVFEEGFREESFRCGEIEIVRVVDATEDQSWPHFWIEVRGNDGLVGTLDNLSFDDLAMSADCNLFLGLSNSGIPRSAVVLFTAKGELLEVIEHPREMELPYCEVSTTLVRTWYDQDDPAVEFEYAAGGELEQITVTDCSGERFPLGHLLGLPE